ncbi:DUF432 domain-containing protein [Thermococcus sp.]|uniref:DUF432 domain-containing protein n=1 Tax=Thermococcus sp. TaxID=35749 RepID=UPI0026170681|nr:DUF432 domain-containing protein [Thermococcus sp.]
MFGEHRLKTQFIKIADQKIHLVEDRKGLVRYRRGNIERLIKGDGEVLKLLPAPAVGYGVSLLMVKLRERIVVPPKGSFQGFLDVPVEIDVEIGNLSIDHFIVGREKYALYGTIENGKIARYHVGPFYVDEPEAMGIAKVILSNPTKEWKGLDRIIFPIRGSTMYYKGNRAYYPLILITLKDHFPEVNNTGKAPVEGAVRVGSGEPLPNFRMRWEG